MTKLLSLSRALVLLALSALVSGCAVGTRLSASKEDYRLYRETRLASTVEERLGASHRYLQRMPRGKWSGEVRSWFKRSEYAYFKASHNSLPRLRAYLLAMPDGPHAAAVTSRLVEVETEMGFAIAREQRTLDEARRVQSKLDVAAGQRRAFVREIVGWLERLVEIRTWGSPTSELDSDFIFHFRLEEPRGACVDAFCRKSVVAAYAIPNRGELSERVAPYEITLELAQGGVVRATLSGPELFSRLGEALELRAVDAAHAQTRVEAIGRVLPLLGNAVEDRLPEGRCGRDPVSPAIFERACDGISVIAIAGSGGQDRDRIVFEPM